MHHSLESHKFFPYVAWTLVVSFAIFTYTLTIRVQEELSYISDGVERLELKLENMEQTKQYQ